MQHQVPGAGWYFGSGAAYLGAGHDPLEVLRDEKFHDALRVWYADLIESFIQGQQPGRTGGRTAIKRAQSGKQWYIESEKLFRTTTSSRHAVGQTLALTTNGCDPHIKMEPLTIVKDLFQGLHKIHIGRLLLPDAYRSNFLAEGIHQRLRLFGRQGLRGFTQQPVVLREMAAQLRQIILGGWLPLQGIVFTDHRQSAEDAIDLLHPFFCLQDVCANGLGDLLQEEILE